MSTARVGYLYFDRCLDMARNGGPKKGLLMSDKQSDKSGQEEPPFNDFDLGLNATHLISDTPRSKKANLVEKVEVKPSEQRRILLGNFTGDKPPKGFSVEVTPDPNPAGSLLTEVTSLGTSGRYKLVMHVTNYGTKTVNVEVWQL
jgi:hypothetical protein